MKKNSKIKKKIWLAVGGVVLLTLLIVFYNGWMSRTRIAFVNFQPVTLQAISQANDNSMIRLYEVETDELHRLGRYDIVMVNGMGLQITAEQRELIQQAANAGKPVYTMMATNPDNNISNFSVDEVALISQYMMNSSRKNMRSMLSFLRRNVDGKIFRAGVVELPEQKMADYLYYPATDPKEDEHAFATVEEYEAFMRSEGLWHEGARKIAVTGMISDPRDMILQLSARGYNVYPVSSMLHVLDYVEQIAPDAIINMAHGRMGDDMVRYLSQHNIPLFDPLNVNMPVEEWEADPMGMMGGFMSQSVVTPEIDGAIRTMAVFGLKKDADGLLQPYAIPERLTTFLNTVDRHIALATKPNSEKRVAIVYYKGPGQGNLTASGMDVVQSLYNTLVSLRSHGYRVEGLPATVSDFRRQIQSEGTLFNASIAGDAARYMKNGHPQMVGADDYKQWVNASLRDGVIERVDEAFGPFPGTGNHLQRDGMLAFPRLQYGNIVLLPQPLAGEGKDVFRITHGTGSVPPHSYIAPYLWIQHGFRADALLHFGTHGSLEFTPQKQVALSALDWPDRLVGELPHFYYYTIDNVGEAMIAKRRTYATLLSYLTPPFHESQLRNTYNSLQTHIADYQNGRGDKHAAAVDIKRLAEHLGLHKDLGIESAEYSEADIERLGNYAEELADEKITDTPYIMGESYSQNDIRTTVYAMTVDPIAYSLYAIDRLLGRAPDGLTEQRSRFNARYMGRANALVARYYGAATPVGNADLQSITGLSASDIAKADSITKAQNAPRGMMAMMMAASRKKNGQRDTAAATHATMRNADRTAIPAAKHGLMAKLMQKSKRKMLAKKDPSQMLAVAKKMGASDEQLKKMEEGLRRQMGSREEKERMTQGEEVDMQQMRHDAELAHAVSELRTALSNVARYRRLLAESPQGELDALLDALNGGYTEPSASGDLIVNPNTLPTGRNLFAINAEETPTADAWEKGVALAKATIADYQQRHDGQYPRKVSYTLWSGEFIQTGGATIAQVLYMLGVEPVRDRYGRVSDLRLIPSEQLGRPRIDVVVQTSGQLRDLAASRLFLISRAVRMAAAAEGDSYDNAVRQGVEESERYLVDHGITPKQAREISYYRVFGGAGGGYGTGIQSLVEQGNAWDDEQQIADIYMNNMGAFYGDRDNWMADMHEAFSAALTRTDVVVQPRQNNTWGALSLDHVYEFMGGMSLAVRQVTGKDPDAVFCDYRNRNNYRMQDSKEAIGVEVRTKLLNPSYIKNAMAGGELHTDEIAEMVRNAYGWNVMKPQNIDKELWDEVYDVYVKDKYNLGVSQQFAAVNPAAMQELTATMMETARKGYWQATDEQLADIATLHADFVDRFGPTGSSFETANPQLQDFIAQRAAPQQAEGYRKSLSQSINSGTAQSGMVMEKQTVATADGEASESHVSGIVVVGVVLLLFVAAVVVVRRRRKNR